MPYPAAPGPPFYFTGATIKNVRNNLPAREKARTHICAPTTAVKSLLKDHLLLQEAARLSFCPRGGLRWTSSLPGRARDCRNRAVKRARVRELHPPAGFVPVPPVFRWTVQVTATPGGYIQ